jgi:hypothetical protein
MARTDFLGPVDSAGGFVSLSGGLVVAYSPSMVSFQAGKYYSSASTATNTTGYGQNNLRFNPFHVGATNNFDRISVSQVAAGGDASNPATGVQMMRLGIYTSGLFGVPQTLLAELGQLQVGSTSGTGVKEITIAITLSPGLYYLASVFQGVTTTSPTFVGYTQSLCGITGTPTNSFVYETGYNLAGVTGPLPSTAAGAVTVASTMKIWLRGA